MNEDEEVMTVAEGEEELSEVENLVAE